MNTDFDRQEMLRCVQEQQEFDIAVIGGGATGLGTALDAASRGYSVVLLEASDFAKGTSSRSTKLIHGGVRYLRSGQVKMVRESLVERARLEANAPHVVHSIKFLIPSFQMGMRWYFFAGMKLYDFLAGKFGAGASTVLSREAAAETLPTLRTEGLRGGVLYSDGQFDDARLALCLAQTAAEMGGCLVNYARVTELTRRTGKTSGLTFVDEENGESYSVKAKVVVNATGVFSESVMKLDPSPDARAPKIVASRGTHIVLDEEFLPGDCALLIPETDDGRVLFAIPWLGKTLVGTTDEETENISLEPFPTSEEVDYILSHVGRYLTRQPQLSDVRSIFAGLRPLVDKCNGAESTASISREHELYTSPSGLLSVIGGKWTTYRKMGEDVVDLALGIARLPRYASRTAHLDLGNVEADGDSTPTAFGSYGKYANCISQLIAESPELADQLHPRLPYCYAEVVWAVQSEMAMNVDDVLARRLRALLLDAQAAIECCPAVAEVVARLLHKDADWQKQQVESFTQLARQYLPVTKGEA